MDIVLCVDVSDGVATSDLRFFFFFFFRLYFLFFFSFSKPLDSVVTERASPRTLPTATGKRKLCV